MKKRKSFNILCLGLMWATNPKKKTFILTRKNVKDLMEEFENTYYK